MAENTMNEKEKYLDEIEDKVRTIGVLTSGGDAPGMNAAIRAVVRRALAKGLKVRGIRRGYHGLLKEEIIDLTARDVSDIVQRGGTILQTARCKTMRTEEGQQKAAAICKKYGIDGLVVIGGDGSFAGAQKLANLGVNTIGVPVSSGNTGQMSGELYSTNNIMNTLNPEDIESISFPKDRSPPDHRSKTMLSL